MTIAVGESGRMVSRVRLIDADELLTAFPVDDEPMLTKSCVRMTIRHMPTIESDVQPVRHGHWETIEGWDGDELYRCSECGAEFVLIDGTPKDNDYWFCPHCGARMDGDTDG